MSTTANQVAYLKWLASAHPAIYRKTMRSLPTDVRLKGLGELGWINFLVQAIATVGSAVIGKKQVDKQVSVQKKALALSDAQAAADRTQAAQLELLEVNTKRAQAGLGPVDLTGKLLNTAGLPTPSALVPYGGKTTTATLIPGVPNLVTYAGGAVLVLLALRMAKVI
jgi:hypothetical protein